MAEKSTKVSTTFINGTTISLDTAEAKFFLTGLALSVIAQSNATENESDGIILNSWSNIPCYDNLIKEYCPGVHGAILWTSLLSQVKVIYHFIEGVVFDNSTTGLYLWWDKTTYGEPCWKLLTRAMDEFMNYVNRRYKLLKKSVPHDFPRYNEYNDKFAALMSKDS